MHAHYLHLEVCGHKLKVKSVLTLTKGMCSKKQNLLNRS